MNLISFRVFRAHLSTVLFGSLCALSVCGCGGIGSPTSSTQTILATGAMAGVVHGGQYPIYNSTVKIWSAGTTGYGSAGTLLATTTTDANGRFQFTKLANGVAGSGPTGSSWSCPASNPDPQIYLTALGGNPTGSGTATPNNAAAALMVAIGPCSTITTSTQVQLNEVTTVATVFALAQYINPGNGAGAASIGTNAANDTSLTGSAATVTQALSAQGAIGLNNAVAGIANLASVSAGAAVTSLNRTGAAATNVSAVTVTVTPESAKLITLANILAACINTTSSGSNNCADLFASASPPPSASVTSQPSATFVTAQDTVQAAYYMAVNPTDAGAFTSCYDGGTTKLLCLYDLPTSSAPFQTGLGAAPTDWTLGVTYNSTSSCLSVSFMKGVYRESVDAYGNVWFMPNDSNTGALAAISPNGTPIYCAKGTIDTTSNYTAGFGNGLTIDTAGNIWAAWGTNIISTTVGEIYEAVSPGAVPSAASMTMSVYTSALLGLPTITSGTYTGTYAPTSLVADIFGNVFFTTNTDFQQNSLSTTGTALGMFIYEIPSGTTVASAATTPAATQVTTSTITTGNSDDVNATNFIVQGLADTVGRLYFVNNSYSNGIVEVTPPSSKITGYSISGGNIVFTGANSFTSTQKVTLSGLTTAEASTLNGTQLQLTGATSTTFTAASSLASIGATTDSGIAVVVPTGPTSYNVVINNIGNAKNYGAAVDNNSYIYTGFDCCGPTTTYPLDTLAKVTINPAGTAITSASGNYTVTAQNLGGIVGIRSTALDGADNVWFGNYAPSVDTTNGMAENVNTGIWSIGELATSGGGSTATFSALSPAPPYTSSTLPNSDTCTSSSNATTGVSGCPVGGGFQKANFQMTEALAVDPSGNIWAGGYGTPIVQTAAGTYLQSITEIIGAGVPVVTPLSNAAANSKLATKP
jgi:hypothetical protein